MAFQESNTFVFGEQPVASKWDQLWRNDDALFQRFAAQDEEDIDTAQTTASTSYADLATTGPSATVTITSSGIAMIILVMGAINSTTNFRSECSFAISGATTRSATLVGDTDDQSLVVRASRTTNPATHSATYIRTGLNAGSTTFKMQYKVQGGTGTFNLRRLTAIPL